MMDVCKSTLRKDMALIKSEGEQLANALMDMLYDPKNAIPLHTRVRVLNEILQEVAVDKDLPEIRMCEKSKILESVNVIKPYVSDARWCFLSGILGGNFDMVFK